VAFILEVNIWSGRQNSEAGEKTQIKGVDLFYTLTFSFTDKPTVAVAAQGTESRVPAQHVSVLLEVVDGKCSHLPPVIAKTFSQCFGIHSSRLYYNVYCQKD